MLDTPIEVKKAYKEGIHKKNYRFVVLNDDGTADFTIDNDTLVKESVNIDERMASGSELKFGLCEGASLEFQYFDHPNINGRTVQAFIDIYYDDVNTHSTPMGFFTVKECPRQFSTGIYKATAYNKLQSEYLDQKANVTIAGLQSDSSDPDTISLKTLQDSLLMDYAKVTVENREKVNLSHSSSSVAYIDLPTLKLTGSSTTYYPRVAFSTGSNPQNIKYYSASVAPNAFFEDQIVIFDDLETIYNYISSISQSFKQYFVQNVQSGETYWSTHSPLFTGMIAIFANGKTGYYLDDDLYALADSSILSSDAFFGKLSGLFYLRGLKYSGSSSDYAMRFIVPATFTLYTNSARTSGEQVVWTTPNSDQINTKISLSREPISEIDGISLNKNTIPDVTLRELVSSSYELYCQYGQLDRQTDLFSGVELNGGGLYPAETLYPADSLYPNDGTGGEGIHPYPSEYSQLWTDTMGEQSFRYLFITYKTLDENNQEIEDVLQRTVNADGTTDYNMSDNWLFRNLVWTAADVGDYADAMVTKMQDIRWFPFEMWAAGLPYVETGDAIEITDREGNTHNSYILQRQLQGIQNLQDTYVNGELDIF